MKEVVIMVKDFNQQLKQELISLAEPRYQQFQSALIPNIDSKTMLGVRFPLLRKIAKRIIKENPKEYLIYALNDSFEEIMLQGMVIGYWKTDLTESLSFVERFIEKIDNWSVCDSFCSGLKLPLQYPAELWDFIGQYCEDEREYYCRFGIVMMLFYYVNEIYIDELLQRLRQAPLTAYYVQMAVAWAISICYASFPEKTLKMLEQSSFDDFTYNKALQKIIELRNISREEKEMLRQRKR